MVTTQLSWEVRIRYVRKHRRQWNYSLHRECYILSPVDNIREDTSVSQENVAVLIVEWQKLRNKQ
jgi:hypothetical protein